MRYQLPEQHPGAFSFPARKKFFFSCIFSQLIYLCCKNSMDAITVIIALFLIAITALYWGAVLPVHLPEFDRRFDRKPFNCRPCSTFHLTWLLSLLSGTASGCTEIIPGGIITAFVLFFITRFFDNKKITK